ncbi:ATP-dependent helicase [Ruminococcus sp. CLA-AA-H200]|uniref:DNA 3'-5' helicase n=1 Tax=Ruminococcus turbiniformis TaxID=2881258 RepID=A0ABS8FV01_9FIRM|nr:ATP-dependent helicase [Ruminococcus turbiniformis]MCC2253870.1 ATP-dependent helicase [Ruminococcus turbiniformis]
MKTDFRDMWRQLNHYQQEAVLDENPACVVNANVGSGKTTVLIAKVLWLHMEKQIPFEDMAVLTFTNKAADEIIARLKKSCEGEIAPEQVHGFGTFHSVALRLLKDRLSVETAGWTKEFTVMDPDEETDLALELITSRGLKVKYKNRLKKRLEQEYGAYESGKAESRYKDDLFALYPLLLKEKKRQNKMAFSDLLRVSTELLSPGGGSADAEAENGVWRPAWVIVDEVQDSDALQMEFLAALLGQTGKGEEHKEHEEHRGKLFAVGDPNQVIYSWRGTGDNMFFLLKHRFGARELTLPVNYRSGASILEAANRFLQFGTGIQGDRENRGTITVKNHYDPFQEAEYLAERIRGMHESGTAYRDIAVFYRLQRQSELLAKVFERHGIPYELSVKETLKDIPVLDWLVKVLRFSVNSMDEQTGIAVLADPLYGEKCTKKKAGQIVREDRRETSELYRRMKEFPCGVFSGKEEEFPSAQALFDWFGLREALHPTSAEYRRDAQTALAFLEEVCAYCGQILEEGPGKRYMDCMREFINSSALYGMKIDAGEKNAADKNAVDGGETGEAPDSVKLMTLHASKGLEFDTVFIIGVNPGLIPLRCTGFEQEEEERRLFFVGMTRAKNELELSWYTNPGEPGVAGEYSRYLKMIPEHLISGETGTGGSSEKGYGLQQMRRQIQENRKKKEQPEEKKVRVRHRKYGEGVLVSDDGTTVEAEFPGYGKKQFLKAFGEVEIK